MLVNVKLEVSLYKGLPFMVINFTGLFNLESMGTAKTKWTILVFFYSGEIVKTLLTGIAI